MRPGWLLIGIVVFGLTGPVGAGGGEVLRQAEDRLAQRLAQDRTGCAKTRILSIVAPSWSEFAKALCKAQMNLQNRVNEAPREELPELLVGLFIDQLTGRGPRETYPPMEDYVTTFGVPAVAPLMARYGEVPKNKRGDVLRALGDIGSEAPLPLIRDEAQRLDPATLPLALYALCQIRGEAAREDLLALLRDPRADEVVITLVASRLKTVSDIAWCDVVLGQLERGRISFDTVKRLDSFDHYPEATVTAHLDYLLGHWIAGDHRTVACLLYQVHDHDAVLRWFPIYPDLLRDKYGYGETYFSLLGSDCRHFGHARNHPLLDRIEKTLTRDDAAKWLRQPSLGWAAYLHLQELAHRKGGPPLLVEDLSFELAFSAHDETHDIQLGEFRGRFRNGVERKVALSPNPPDGEPCRVTLAPELRKDAAHRDRWAIHVPLLMVEKPTGYGFSPFTIPLEAGQTFRIRGDGRTIRWQVRHVGGPPALSVSN